MTARQTRGATQRVTENPKTTINLPPDLKMKAKIHALKTGRDLQDLIAEGLRLVLAKEGGR